MVATRRPPTVGFFGILGSGNLGNDGSLDVVVRHLRRRRPDVRLTFMGMGPDTLAARYGAPASSLQWFEAHAPVTRGAAAAPFKAAGRLVDVHRTARWVRSCDAVVVPGMGVLEATLPLRPWSFPLSLRALTGAGRRYGVPVALVAAGASDVRGRATRRLLRDAAAGATYVSVRDDLSRAALARIGVGVPAERVVPDLAFGLVPDRRPPRPGCVVVGVMAFRGGPHDRRDAATLQGRYLRSVTELVRHLQAQGRTVLLVTADPEDVAPAEHVARAVGLPAGRMHHPDSLGELVSLASEAEVVVASRYHNVLAGLLAGRPTLSLGYARKHHVLLQDFGLGAFSLDAFTTDAAGLLSGFAALDDAREQLAGPVGRRCAELADGVTAALDDATAALGLSAALGRGVRP